MRTLKQRVEEALAAGHTRSQLAKAANVSPSAVSQWLSSDTSALKGSSAAGLAALTGWSAVWWADGKGPRDIRSSVDQLLSPDEKISSNQPESIRVAWGNMNKNLPDLFEAEVPDDAMADRVLRGHTVKFATGLEPRAGDGVLVADGGGAWFFRVYSPGAQGRFSAVAKNPAYQTLDSERDGLKVLAVLVGVPDARWG